MSMRDIMIRDVIEKWHPGSMDASAAVNGKIIVPPQTLFDAQNAVYACLDAMYHITDAMEQTLRDRLKESHSTVSGWQATIRVIKEGK